MVTRTKKKTIQKKATQKKATASRKKTTAKKTLPKMPEILKEDTPKATAPSAPKVLPRVTTTKYVVKKSSYKNFELFKKYFDFGLGILMSTVVGFLVLAAIFGAAYFFKEAQYFQLTYMRVFAFLFASYLIGAAYRAENQ